MAHGRVPNSTTGPQKHQLQCRRTDAEALIDSIISNAEWVVTLQHLSIGLQAVIKDARSSRFIGVISYREKNFSI